MKGIYTSKATLSHTEKENLEKSLFDFCEKISYSLENKFTFRKEENRDYTFLMDISPSEYKIIKLLVYANSGEFTLLENIFSDFFCDQLTISPEGKDHLKKEEQELLKLSSSFVKKPIKSNVEEYEMTAEEEKKWKDTCFENILKKLIGEEKFKYIVLGEYHDEIITKVFLLENIDLLKKHGVILIVENMCFDVFQEQIDSCFKSQTYSPLMEFLTPLIPKISIKPALKETYYPKQKELFKSLFINGTTIIGGDTSVSNSFPPNEDRLLAYNYTSVKNYREYIKIHEELEENPVIFLCGAKHVEETKYIKSITSLLEEAPAVSVFLRDNYKGKIEHVSVKKKFHAFEITIEKSIEELLKIKNTFSFAEKIKEEKNTGELAR